MALSLVYINEVLNRTPCTVVVSQEEWPGLLAAFKFEQREPKDLVLGRMTLRWAPGGYDGVMQRLEELTQQRDEARKELETLKATHANQPEAVAAS